MKFTDQCQVKSEKAFISNKLHYQIQYELRDKVDKNEIGFILECFSGMRRRHLLKCLLFLVTNSQHKHIRISHERLARVVGVSRDTIRRYIRKLKEATFITVISESHTRKNKLPNIYEISPIFFMKNLKTQLSNMLYETQEKFRAPLNNILKEYNYNNLDVYTSNDIESMLIKEDRLDITREWIKKCLLGDILPRSDAPEGVEYKRKHTPRKL